MPFSPPRAPKPLSILALALLDAGLSACATRPVAYLNASPCSQLVPDAWKSGVGSAPLPKADTVGEWVAFGDAQTAQLDKANERTADALGIVARCEARDREAGRTLAAKPWWAWGRPSLP